MINFSKVTKASDYNSKHLSHNDHYEEGCRVEGYFRRRGRNVVLQLVSSPNLREPKPKKLQELSQRVLG